MSFNKKQNELLLLVLEHFNDCDLSNFSEEDIEELKYLENLFKAKNEKCDNKIEDIVLWLIEQGLTKEEIQKTYERYKWHIETLPKQNEELLNALKNLWSVRTEPWTDEQRQLKFKTECEVEEILNKYNK